MAILFIAPSIILLLAISIFPLIWSVYLSFTRYQVTGISLARNGSASITIAIS